jgi:hypothetical protein
MVQGALRKATILASHVASHPASQVLLCYAFLLYALSGLSLSLVSCVRIGR